MFCSVYSADIEGISAQLVSVEADVTGGLPSFQMVGLLASEVREAKERVMCALANSGYDVPSRRITINLSPANIKKRGSGFDIAIAVAVLCCLGIVKREAIKDKVFVGELSLDGTINKVNGILPITIMAQEKGMKMLVIPQENRFEGAVIDGIKVCGVSNLKELVENLNTDRFEETQHVDLEELLNRAYASDLLDYQDIKGQEHAKRATLIAVAGFHNLLYIGPPGSGKSMMAARIPSILNRLTKEECLEISKIYSVLGKLGNHSLILNRPFRAPHHSITAAAFIGGMGIPRPGEITLAHKGVLFLDEVAEFKKETIELLRQPLEDKKIEIARSGHQFTFPADFMLVMAMNPCKCGYYPDRNYCKCSQQDVDRYLGKIRGPIMDRIDICTATNKLAPGDFTATGHSVSSRQMREQVLLAQAVQESRFRDCAIHFNAQMTKKEIDRFCVLEEDAKRILQNAYEKLHMTARGYYKSLKVARTIADLEGSEMIGKQHVLEAVNYRNHQFDL